MHTTPEGMALENVRKAELLKTELDQLRPLDREQEARIMQKFRLDWNYHSNHLEGNSLTFGETKALILHGITAQGKPLKDHFEITGHDEAIKWVEDVIKDKTPLTEHFIRQLHTLLLKEPHEKDAITPDGKPTKRMIQVGKYKNAPNHVKTKTGEIFYFATPEETPAKMHDLLEWYKEQKESKELNAVLLAAEFHYKFIRIHPFDDGNGRTARILMNFILMQFGYPPVIIKTEDKENYFIALQQADAGIIEPFIDYIGQNLVRSLEIMIRGAKGENIDEDDDIDKEIFLLEQKLNTIGKKITVLKSLNSMRNVFTSSLQPFLDVLISSCHKFDGFYLSILPYIQVDSGAGYGYGPATLEKLTTEFKLTTKSITFTFLHKSFNRDGIEEFNHNSSVRFEFEQKKYLIKNNLGKIFYSKFYDEKLSKEEMKAIAEQYSKKHLAFIKEKIKQTEKEKK